MSIHEWCTSHWWLPYDTALLCQDSWGCRSLWAYSCGNGDSESSVFYLGSWCELEAPHVMSIPKCKRIMRILTTSQVLDKGDPPNSWVSAVMVYSLSKPFILEGHCLGRDVEMATTKQHPCTCTALRSRYLLRNDACTKEISLVAG